eukprot:6422320-Prymnesium_polylepis.1
MRVDVGLGAGADRWLANAMSERALPAPLPRARPACGCRQLAAGVPECDVCVRHLSTAPRGLYPLAYDRPNRRLDINTMSANERALP